MTNAEESSQPPSSNPTTTETKRYQPQNSANAQMAPKQRFKQNTKLTQLALNHMQMEDTTHNTTQNHMKATPLTYKQLQTAHKVPHRHQQKSQDMKQKKTKKKHTHTQRGNRKNKSTSILQILKNSWHSASQRLFG